MNPLFIVVIVLAVVLLWLIFSYNRLVTLRLRAREALSDIDVQLKRRYDLIPNLVETVKGYMTHEKTVLENVTRARAALMTGTTQERAKAENILEGALKSLFAVAENYPQLKANENFMKLQDELSDTENKIQAARRFYNTNIRDLNTSIETFPTNLVARAFNFKQEEFFEAEEEAERKPVAVKF